MKAKGFLPASLLVFVFIALFEWIFHGSILHELYVETAYLWRAPEDCIMLFMYGGQFLFALVFTYIFMQNFENKGFGEGIRYGALIGLLFIPVNFMWYAVMPLPFDLISLWCIGGLLELTVCGALAALLVKPAT